MSRRNDLDVQADILQVARARHGALKTHIVYGANLNFLIVKKYLARLIRGGLLVHEGSRYFPTEKASAYLEAYEALSSFRGLEADVPDTRVTEGVCEVI